MAERVAAEEAEAAQKREKEEQLAEQRRQRDLERAAAAEEARKKALREEEAAERARLRSQQAKTVPATGDAWRARAPAQTSVPPRAQNSAPAPSPVSATGPPKIGIAPGGWRQRERKNRQGRLRVLLLRRPPPRPTPRCPIPKRTRTGSRWCRGKALTALGDLEKGRVGPRCARVMYAFSIFVLLYVSFAFFRFDTIRLYRVVAGDPPPKRDAYISGKLLFPLSHFIRENLL